MARKPTVRTLPSAPTRAQPNNFAAAADAFLGQLPAWGGELNQLATWIEETVQGSQMNGRVLGLWAVSFSGVTPATSVDTIIQRQENTWSLWIERPTAPNPVPSDYQQSADSRWWKRVAGSADLDDLKARPATIWSKDWTTNRFAPDVDTVIQRTETSWSIWINRPTPPAPLPVGRVEWQQTTDGKWWKRVIGDTEISALFARSLASPIWLESIGGTTDAITAQYPAAYSDLALGNNSRFWFIPTQTNSAAAPTIAIGTAAARRLRDEKGVDLPIGRLRAGAPHLCRIASNGTADVIGVAIGINDVAAIFDRPAGPAVNTYPDFAIATQESAALPVRPRARIVEWLTWDDPSALMAFGDRRRVIDPPSNPPAPLAGDWELLDARTGDSLVIRLSGIPIPVPSIIAVEYQVNGGSWVRVNGAYRGDDITVGGLTSGQSVNIAIRYRNYLGAGGTSTKSRTPTSNNFGDIFNRPNGPLIPHAKWEAFGQGGTGNRMLMIDNNQLIAGNTNETYGATVKDEYFPPNHFAQVNLLSSGTMAGSPRGAYLWVRADAAGTNGYALRLAGTAWYLDRYDAGAATRLASGTVTAPAVYRLEAVGGVIRVRAAGVIVGTYVDPAPIPDGRVGLAIHNGAGDATGAVRVDDFLAGAAS